MAPKKAIATAKEPFQSSAVKTLIDDIPKIREQIQSFRQFLNELDFQLSNLQPREETKACSLQEAVKLLREYYAKKYYGNENQTEAVSVPPAQEEQPKKKTTRRTSTKSKIPVVPFTETERYKKYVQNYIEGKTDEYPQHASSLFAQEDLMPTETINNQVAKPLEI